MKENQKQENNKNNSKFHIFSTTLGFFKFYTLNSFKNISNKIYSFYPLSTIKKKKEINIINNINLIDNEKNLDLDKNLIETKENDLFNKRIINNINNNENELLIYNNFQIKKNIYIFLENELKINDKKIELKNSKNNQLTQINKYKELKTKIFIYFFSSTIIEKYYNIISISSLSIISILKRLKVYTNKNQIKLILDNLWEISNKTSKNIFSNISEIISNYIEKIRINEKYTKNSFDELITQIQKELREKCNFFIHITKEIKNEIKNIEEQFYDDGDFNKEYKLRFLYFLCDIIFSDLFYSSFVQTYEEEIFKQIEEIKKNFGDKKEKTFVAIILDMDAFKNKQFVLIEENKTNLDNDNNKDNILINYQKCLQSIFL